MCAYQTREWEDLWRFLGTMLMLLWIVACCSFGVLSLRANRCETDEGIILLLLSSCQIAYLRGGNNVRNIVGAVELVSTISIVVSFPSVHNG